MNYLKKSKQWQSPSFLIWLLGEQITSLKNVLGKTNEDTFDKKCNKDTMLRKNLEMELSDITTTTAHLATLINNKPVK